MKKISAEIVEKELKIIGANVKRIRVSKGLSEKDFGKIIKCSSDRIRDIERGNINFRLITLVTFAEKLEVSMEDLLRR